MPAYTIETPYTLPIFRHGTYITDTLEEACKAALADDDWESLQKDYDVSGEVHVTGIWKGEKAHFTGSSVPVPSQFDEVIQRRADHFEILLGLLKMMVHDAHATRGLPPYWRGKAAWAIARGEAILACAADPEEPIDAPRANHVLARLHEDRVRSAIAAVLDVDDSFGSLLTDSVTDEEIQSACETTISMVDLSGVVSNAEFHARMTAIRSAARRLHPE
ncbi:hypothetical protein G6M84_12370 [Agrobacterium tumefaciens]|uniref:hypothetical protein n=1 Tax=Agrobacterium tumefaciens TaxID=358 RepID=UPI001571C324|nr:hypothetical protein [Agrobacterium tumefaciens]NTB97291.1 hypothetical protein [Agrobacterium tumefaciens]NTC45147.1 hypothetical protein [Agrobacterium tumefaciens]